MSDHDLHLDLGERGYPIHIAPGNLERADTLLAPILADGPILIIADATVAELYGRCLTATLAGNGNPVSLTAFPAGEEAKTLATADALWQACADARIDRGGTIVALGGGVSGDLAGFVAACWMRGVRFVQIPTTLLAMVDSSVGGKTGVNSPAGKNLIGAFHQPDAVVIDPLLLTTMHDREYAAGLAEVVKYGIIRDPAFLDRLDALRPRLLAREPEALGETVHRCCALKAWFVSQDEREQGMRAHLNYGHTFGHALERDTDYRRYLHGEAVAIGMAMAAECARRIDLLEDDQLIPRQNDLLRAFGLPLRHDDANADASRLAGHCGLDKKVRSGRTRFILPRRIGAVETVENPDPAAVIAAFQSALGVCNG